MFRLNKLFSFLILLLISSQFAVAQDKDKKDKKEIPDGTPVMWERVDVSAQDLLLGPGGNAMRPDTSSIEFIKEEEQGTNTKYRIKDGAGRVWVAKLGKEAQSETAAVRLLWALGYRTEINYLVPKLTIPGKGTFTNVRLEARPENVKRLDEWKWKENPFAGTDEFQGLKVMMALLNNWDLKDDNNKIFLIKDSDNNELQYVISDLGATFGKTGSIPVLWRIQRSRNEPEDYRKASFVNDVKDGRVGFTYNGKMRELFDDITVDQTRWIANLLSQLRDEQIRDAFRAANYTKEEVNMLTQSVKNRIAELNRAAGSSAMEGKRDD